MDPEQQGFQNTKHVILIHFKCILQDQPNPQCNQASLIKVFIADKIKVCTTSEIFFQSGLVTWVPQL